MPNVTHIEILEGTRPSSSPASHLIPTTVSPVKSDDEVSGHYAISRVVKCWSCGGLSCAQYDDTLASQAFTCTACGQINQL